MVKAKARATTTTMWEWATKSLDKAMRRFYICNILLTIIITIII